MKQKILTQLSSAIKTYWPDYELLVPWGGHYHYPRYIFWFVKNSSSKDVICIYFNKEDDDFSIASIVCWPEGFLDAFKKTYNKTGEDIGLLSYYTLKLYVTPYQENDYLLNFLDDGRLLEADIKVISLELIDWIDKGFL